MLCFPIPTVDVTVCQYQFQKASRNGFPGVYVPDCKTTGGYKDVQCRGSYCFCVDKRGNELKGTKKSISEGRPDCNRPGTNARKTRINLCFLFSLLEVGYVFDYSHDQLILTVPSYSVHTETT